MASKHESKLIEQLGPELEKDEEVLATLIAAVRGHTKTAVSAGVAGVPTMGTGEQGKARNAAQLAGVELANPMGVALTNQRLLLIKISTSWGMGIGGNFQEMIGSVPLDEVESIEVKRIAARQNITLGIRGQEIKLEANAAAGGKKLEEAFARAKSLA